MHVLFGGGGVCPGLAIEPEQTELDLVRVRVRGQSQLGNADSPVELAVPDVEEDRPFNAVEVVGVKCLAERASPVVVQEVRGEASRVGFGEPRYVPRAIVAASDVDQTEAL